MGHTMSRLRLDTATGHIRGPDDTPLCGGRPGVQTPAGNCATCIHTVPQHPDSPFVLDGTELRIGPDYAADILAGHRPDGPPPDRPEATWQTVASPGTTRTHIALDSLTIAHDGQPIRFPAATTLCRRPIGQAVTGHIDPADRCVTCARLRRTAELADRPPATPGPMTTAVFLDHGDPIGPPQPHQRIVVADIDTLNGCAALTGFRMPSLDGTTAHDVDGAPKTSGKGPAYTTEVVDHPRPCPNPRRTMLGGCSTCADTIRSVARSAQAEWAVAIGAAFVAIAIDGNPVPTDILLTGSTSEPAADPTLAGRWRPGGHGRCRMDRAAVPNGRTTHLTWSTWSTTDQTGQVWDARPAQPARTLCGKTPTPTGPPAHGPSRWCTACGNRMAAVLTNPDRITAAHPGLAIDDTHLAPDAGGLPLPLILGLLDRNR